MGALGQWYYLEGDQPRGPLDAQQIVQMINSGALSSSVQVAQAGWPQWSPASAVLGNMFSAPAPQPAPPPGGEQQPLAIQVRCLRGPDTGKAFMIGASEVAVGRVAGIGVMDPAVADRHAALSWRGNVLYFRAFPGCQIGVNGMYMSEGGLTNGQQFQMGSSIWQVGAAPVQLAGLLQTIGDRINRLASTDKLEGFSLKEMFSDAFKKRTTEELDEYFVVGTSKTTPRIEDVQTGWPKPWFFVRVLMFIGVAAILFSLIVQEFHNSKAYPGFLMMGSLALPLATMFLFFELNSPRNVSFHYALTMFVFGGVVSIFVALIGYSFGGLDWLGASAAGIVEEIGKFLAVILIVRELKYKYILNGMLFGAAVGAGFAAFESAGYSFELYVKGYSYVFVTLAAQNHIPLSQLSIPQLFSFAETVLAQSLPVKLMAGNMETRAFLTPFGHVAWTAIAAGAFWRVKGDKPVELKMFFDPRFWRAFLIPVVLHMIWNLDLPKPFSIVDTFEIRHLVLGVIGWYVVFGLVQQGLRQIKDEQYGLAQEQLTRTQDLITASGIHRATA